MSDGPHYVLATNRTAELPEHDDDDFLLTDFLAWRPIAEMGGEWWPVWHYANPHITDPADPDEWNQSLFFSTNTLYRLNEGRPFDYILHCFRGTIHDDDYTIWDSIVCTNTLAPLAAHPTFAPHAGWIEGELMLCAGYPWRVDGDRYYTPTNYYYVQPLLNGTLTWLSHTNIDTGTLFTPLGSLSVPGQNGAIGVSRRDLCLDLLSRHGHHGITNILTAYVDDGLGPDFIYNAYDAGQVGGAMLWDSFLATNICTNVWVWTGESVVWERHATAKQDKLDLTWIRSHAATNIDIRATIDSRLDELPPLIHYDFHRLHTP